MRLLTRLAVSAFAIGFLSTFDTSPFPDDLDHVSNSYIHAQCHREPVQSSVENELERILGVCIAGEPTADDILYLYDLFTDPEYANLAYVREFDSLGIEFITILPEHEKEKVDYSGKALQRRNEVRLFAGRVEKKGNARHELVHFDIWRLEKQGKLDEDREYAAQLSGDYQVVKVSRKRSMKGAKGFIDEREDGEGMRLGFALLHGALEFDEDVATYTAVAASKPSSFEDIRNCADIYPVKLMITRKRQWITEREMRDSLDSVELAYRPGETTPCSLY